MRAPKTQQLLVLYDYKHLLHSAHYCCYYFLTIDNLVSIDIITVFIDI